MDIYDKAAKIINMLYDERCEISGGFSKKILFIDLFREIGEENDMTGTDNDMDELDDAIDNGFFIFSDGYNTNN